MNQFISSRRWLVAGVFLLTVVAGTAARAAVTINIYESGSDVVATGFGSILLPAVSPVDGFGIPAVVPSIGTILVGYGTADDQYNGIVSGPDAFGPGGPFYATSGSGDYFGLDGSGNLIVPVDYTSGAAINSTATWVNTSLADLGLTDGQYLYTIADTGDTVTFNVGAAVPEPSTGALMVLGAGVGFAVFRLRRKVRR